MTTLVGPPPALADGLELLGGLQGSGHRSAPGLARRADGQTVQVTTVLYALLELVDGSREEAELAALLGERLDREVTPDDVRFLLHERAAALGLLRGADGSQPVVAKANPLLALRLKVVVADPVWTWRLTTPFAALFSPVVVVPVLLAFAWTTWWLLTEQGLAAAARDAVYAPGMLLAVVGITVASAGFHELGHAAACRYGGARPGAMGAGVYLVWPAFFTDVDDSYRLSRWGRLRVDLGGLYFNAVVAVALAGAWLVGGQDALLLGIATQLLQMVRQLAPFVRADGYHLLADLTGVPDLFAHLGPTLRSLVPGGPRRPSPLKAWARVVVTAWVLVVVPVLAALLVAAVLVLPRLVVTACDSAGLRLDALAAAAGTGDPVRAGAEVLALLALVLPVLGITYLLLRVVRRTALRAWRLTDGRPRARSLAVLAGLLLAGLVAWSWVPETQRTPIASTDRGTVTDVVASVPVVLEQAVAQVPAPRAPAPAAVSAPVLAPAVTTTSAAVRPAVALGPSTTRSLRFKVPLPPGALDNQALAIGLVDGRTTYDLAYAVVELRDGADVRSRNEAWALASCHDCRTVAVALQVVLVVGASHVVVPVNVAVAANDSCLRCTTTALALQLVTTLKEAPSREVRREVDAELRRLLLLRRDLDELDEARLLARVEAVQASVLAVLVRNGLVDTGRPATERRTIAGPAAVAALPADRAPEAGEPFTGPVAEQPVAETARAEPAVEPVVGTPVEPTTGPTTEPAPQPVIGPTAEPAEPSPTPEPTPTTSPAPTSEPATATADVAPAP